MTKWEYQTRGFNVTDGDFDRVDKTLSSEEGSLGWEVYAIQYSYPIVSYFMKRLVASVDVKVITE